MENRREARSWNSTAPKQYRGRPSCAIASALITRLTITNSTPCADRDGVQETPCAVCRDRCRRHFPAPRNPRGEPVSSPRDLRDLSRKRFLMTVGFSSSFLTSVASVVHTAYLIPTSSFIGGLTAEIEVCQDLRHYNEFYANSTHSTSGGALPRRLQPPCNRHFCLPGRSRRCHRRPLHLLHHNCDHPSLEK